MKDTNKDVISGPDTQWMEVPRAPYYQPKQLFLYNYSLWEPLSLEGQKIINKKYCRSYTK